jgi:exopolysaccharide production protein ExoZ
LANALALGHAAHVQAADQRGRMTEAHHVLLAPTERLPCVDALRGVMALCVAAYHFASFTHAFKSGSAAASAIALLGIYSVQGFFIISGLCFFHSYYGQYFSALEAKRFYVRRFFRIAPLYYAVLLLNLVLGQAVWPRFSWGRIVENVTLTFGLFHPNHAMVLGGWSIGIECVFYLAFPLLLWLCRKPGGLLLLLVLSSLLPWLLEGSLRAAPEAARFHAYVRIGNHAFLFLLGALIAASLRRATALVRALGLSRFGSRADPRASTQPRLPGLLLLLMLSALAVLALEYMPPVYDHFALMYGAARVAGVGACFALVLLCAFGRIRRADLFAPFRVLGDLSYAVYLLHPFVWQLIAASGLSARDPRFVFCASLALSVALAALVHALFEKPLLAWGRRLSARIHDPDQAARAELTRIEQLSAQA